MVSHEISGKADHQPGQPQSAIISFGLSVTHNLTQIMLGGVVFSALVLPNMSTTAGSYRQHIYLCTIGYFIMMTQAILAFSPFGWATHLNYDHKRIIHAGMQIIGSIFVIIGSIIRIVGVTSNFNTAHGITAWFAMFLTILTLVGGLASLISPKLMNNRYVKMGHAVLGAATLLLAFIAMITAFNNYYRSGAGDANANTAICLTVFALIGTLTMACMKHVKRILN